jgi:hypothetical protein
MNEEQLRCLEANPVLPKITIDQVYYQIYVRSKLEIEKHKDQPRFSAETQEECLYFKNMTLGVFNTYKAAESFLLEHGTMISHEIFDRCDFYPIFYIKKSNNLSVYHIENLIKETGSTYCDIHSIAYTFQIQSHYRFIDELRDAYLITPYTKDVICYYGNTFLGEKGKFVKLDTKSLFVSEKDHQKSIITLEIEKHEKEIFTLKEKYAKL